MATDQTTITLNDETKTRLERYRSDRGHYSWSETLEALMDVLPTIEQFQAGCLHCGREPTADFPAADPGGVVMWANPEGGPPGTYYFCSMDCAHAEHERWASYVPEYPDLVVVGGAEEMRCDVTNATYYLDDETMEIGIPLPGAFGGADNLGHEYDYLGEPVYIKNDDRWVNSGIIESIIHEETHTALILGHGEPAVLREHHPDEEKRETPPDEA